MQTCQQWGSWACDLAGWDWRAPLTRKAPFNILKPAVIIFSTAGGDQSHQQLWTIFPGRRPIRTPVIRAAKLDFTIPSFLLTAWSLGQESCWRKSSVTFTFLCWKRCAWWRLRVIEDVEIQICSLFVIVSSHVGLERKKNCTSVNNYFNSLSILHRKIHYACMPGYLPPDLTWVVFYRSVV